MVESANRHNRKAKATKISQMINQLSNRLEGLNSHLMQVKY